VSSPFDSHSAAVSDSHLPCQVHALLDHAVLLKATAHHGRRETACGLHAGVRLLPVTTRICTKIGIRRIPIFITTIHTHDCKEWQQDTTKRRSVKLLDKQFGYFRLPRGISRRVLHCRSMAGAQHGMCELTVWERHGNGMDAAWERHVVCESALIVLQKFQVPGTGV